MVLCIKKISKNEIKVLTVYEDSSLKFYSKSSFNNENEICDWISQNITRLEGDEILFWGSERLYRKIEHFPKIKRINPIPYSEDLKEAFQLIEVLILNNNKHIVSSAFYAYTKQINASLKKFPSELTARYEKIGIALILIEATIRKNENRATSLKTLILAARLWRASQDRDGFVYNIEINDPKLFSDINELVEEIHIKFHL